MQIVINIPNAPIKDYQDLYYKIHGMAASEGLFDDKEKSQRALALKAVLDILDGIVDGTPLPKDHGRLIDYGYVVDAIDDWINAEEYRYTNATYYLRKRIRNVPTILKPESEENK